MFSRAILFSIGGFSLLFVLWGLQLGFVRPSDIEKCKKICAQQHESSNRAPLLQSAHQSRRGVRKDIWFSQEDNSRLHYRLESRSSLLTLVPKEQSSRKLEIIENLKDLKCWMQDKLYLANAAPMQQVRYFEADKGTYQYTTQQFIAEQVGLSVHRLPGHLLPIACENQPTFLKGVAKDVSFSVAGNTPQFQAKNFKASLIPGAGLE